MDIKQLFLKNKKQFSYYILGILLTIPSNFFVTFALANTFNLFNATSTNEIIKIILLSVSLGFSPVLLQVLSRYLRIGFMRDVLFQVRVIAYKKLLSNNVYEFSKKSDESFQKQLVSDINLFESDFFLSILNIVFSFGNFLLGVFVLFVISPLLSLMTIIVSIVLFILASIFKKPTIKKKEAVLNENSNYHSLLSNTIKGLEIIKLYRVKDIFFNKFKKGVNDLEKSKQASFKIQNYQKNIMAWVSGSFQLFTIIYAAYLFSQNKILLTSLVFVFNLIGQIIWGLNNGFSMVNRYQAAIKVFNDITYYPPNIEKMEDFTFTKELVVKDLSFKYKNDLVLNNINFKLNKNEKLLISGESGSGKTTLINILSKNISNYCGKVLFDNKELSLIDYQSLSKSIGYVRQEHFIFDESIKNNIILDQEYNEEKFKKVIEAVDLTLEIKNFKNNENHLLYNNGENISGGQRQRINIARELYKDRPFMIFDEPSASLDDETAEIVYNSILNLNKTIIIVSHRHIDYLKNQADKSIILKEESK